jgi:hypothetical protein
MTNDERKYDGLPQLAAGSKRITFDFCKNMAQLKQNTIRHPSDLSIRASFIIRALSFVISL